MSFLCFFFYIIETRLVQSVFSSILKLYNSYSKMAYIKKLGWYITLPGKPDVTYQFIQKVISYLGLLISFLRVMFTHNSYVAYASLQKNCNQKRRALDIKSKRTKTSLAQLTDCTCYSRIRFPLHTLIAVNRN